MTNKEVRRDEIPRCCNECYGRYLCPGTRCSDNRISGGAMNPLTQGSELGSFEIESHYDKNDNGVFYYWRVVGSDTWNVQKTALKDIPYVELTPKDSKEKT